MQKEKAVIRKKLLAQRRALTKETISKASLNIARQVIEVVDWRQVHNVHIYYSLPVLGEVDTQPIIDWLAVAYPDICVTVGEGALDAPFPEGSYDVIFVPVLGFDRGGFRLGMGGGWYDRWLKTQPQAYKIGLAYVWAELQNLPHEPHDVPLDQVLTG